MIKLVASDLDGTLLRDGAQMPNPQVYDSQTAGDGSSFCSGQWKAVFRYETNVCAYKR